MVTTKTVRIQSTQEPWEFLSECHHWFRYNQFHSRKTTLSYIHDAATILPIPKTPQFQQDLTDNVLPHLMPRAIVDCRRVWN